MNGLVSTGRTPVTICTRGTASTFSIMTYRTFLSDVMTWFTLGALSTLCVFASSAFFINICMAFTAFGTRSTLSISLI